MPQKKKNSWNFDGKNILTTLGELTVHDVANSDRKRQCIKKNSISGMFNKAQLECHAGRQLARQDAQAEEEAEEEEMDQQLSYIPLTGIKRKRRRRVNSIINSSGCLELPIDFWELISDHILPEDVGRFAAICRTTAQIVSMARFWHSLYKRWCLHCPTLPDELSWSALRQCAGRGVRSLVVRALHLSYQPFHNTLSLRNKQNPLAFGSSGLQFTRESPSTVTILHARCLHYYHQRCGSRHHYVFKFLQRDRLPNQVLFGRWLNEANTTGQEYVRQQQQQAPACQDPEDACYLLHLTCSNYCQVDSSVMGQYLNMMCVTPAEVTNYRMTKMTITFSGAPFTSQHRSHAYSTFRGGSGSGNVYRPIGWNDTIKVVLQPVECVRLLPWWHPDYYKVLFPHHCAECDKSQTSDIDMAF